jgi:hypothetical protein
MLTAREEATMKAEHYRKYEELTRWLGLDALKSLVPFPADRIRQALESGDEHLNTLPLHVWDKQDGGPRKVPTEKCKCCNQTLPVVEAHGMWALVARAIASDRRHGLPPKCTSWSLSQTVCVLKHVARYYVAQEA